MRALIIVLALIGCGQEIKDFRVSNENPNFAHHREPLLESYMLAFDKTYNANSNHISTFFKKLDSDTVGLATWYENGVTKIEIDPVFWKSASDLGKEQLMLHEYGHAVWHLEHNENTIYIKNYGAIPESIMYPSVFGDFYYYKDFHSYYIKELKP